MKRTNIKLKHMSLLVASVILLGFSLLGFGCKDNLGVAEPQLDSGQSTSSDTGPSVQNTGLPNGWKRLRSRSGINIAYPEGWFVQEDTRYSGILHVNFNPTELPPMDVTKADIFPALTLAVEDGLVSLDRTEWDFTNETDISVGTQRIFKGVYLSELLDGESVAVYWWQFQGKTYTIVGFATDPVTEEFVSINTGLWGKE